MSWLRVRYKYGHAFFTEIVCVPKRIPSRFVMQYITILKVYISSHNVIIVLHNKSTYTIYHFGVKYRVLHPSHFRVCLNISCLCYAVKHVTILMDATTLQDLITSKLPNLILCNRYRLVVLPIKVARSSLLHHSV